MECDFSGWATKADIRCSDGRTIMPNAFQHQDSMQVPLVWQHGHNDPENVLGHAILEHRPEGVYTYCFFNSTAKAKHAAELVQHKDINQMSIWANELMERSKRVLHGAIKEVSLVLSGANPGALIDNITIRHSDGEDELLDEEAIITTGLEFEHSDFKVSDDSDSDEDVTHTDSDVNVNDLVTAEVQRQLELQHASEDMTVQDIYDSMSEDQKQVLHYMVGVALEGDSTLSQSDLGDETDDQEGSTEMRHNVFENDGGKGSGPELVISHDDMKGIISSATGRGDGSLKAAVQEYALSHGIESIDLLFPDAVNVNKTPELFGRRTEWVAKLMGGVRKSPFSRIKTMSADITVAEARAKGYIKGSLKKEEFFKVSKRVTNPTTIYKKQKLDRDDMIDITDFDVVAWLKGEMRLMLDEELARAILVGDGRAADDEDKIDEDAIRPIATDHELYTTQIYVNIGDASSGMHEVSDAIALHRSDLRGSGMPVMFTTETVIAKFMTQRDTLNRRLFQSLDSLATELRVSDIVAVEVLEEYPTILGILVNPADYQVGATAGGEVSMFDDFDIDYNQYKYLIETRCSGALTKLKSALVVNSVASGAALATPTAPTFSGTAITITNTTGVVYRNAGPAALTATGGANVAVDAVVNAAGSPYALADGLTTTIHAEPASSSYFFESSDVDDWEFTNEL
jgi:hypothetical protein